MNLKNKVVIVTGGARDIGKAISLKLSSLGAKVVINFFDNPLDAEETLKEIKSAGNEAIIVQGDMTKQTDVTRLVDEATRQFGNEIHVLVNVVGGLVARKSISEMDEEFWDFLMEVNLKSVFLTTKTVYPFMKSGASIINFSSQAARDGGGPGASAYATAKGAVMTYTRSMAKEFGPLNIRVNAICPGMISTTFHDRFTKDEVRQKVASATPLRREGTAAEIAEVVAFLSSEASSFVTGAGIDINGGTYFS